MNTGKVNTVRRMGDWGGTFSTHQEEGKNSALGEEMRRRKFVEILWYRKENNIKIVLTEI